MSINTQQLETLVNQLKQVREQLIEIAKNVFVESVSALFKEYKDLESFGWRQWTPYWNDGKPAPFAANIDPDSIYINGSSTFDDIYEDGEEMTDEENRRAEEMSKMVSEILHLVGDSNLELMFGDHVDITIHRNGDIEVIGFEDHD